MPGPKTRIIELQRQVRVARLALTRIVHGSRNAEAIASEALENMWPLDRKQPLQGVVGHDLSRGAGSGE